LALFKNLYLDFSYLNPFKKKNSSKAKFSPIEKEPTFSDRSFLTQQESVKKEIISESVLNSLPPVSKNLIDDKLLKKEKLELPKIPKTSVLPPPSISQNQQSLNLSQKKPEEIQKTQQVINPSTAKQETIIKAKLENLQAKQEKPVQPRQEIIQSKQEMKLQPSTNLPKDTTFFSGLYSHLSKDEAYVHSNISKTIVSKDLFEEMQSFWQDKKEELAKTEFNNSIKQDLIKRMQELEQLELDWQRLQRQNEKTSDELASKEILIENHTKYLKKTFKKLHMGMPTKPEHYFVLSNGIKLSSLQEFSDNLKSMQPEIFHAHVNDGKNDFANWVNDVMGLTDLSQEIRGINSREEMANAIERWSNSF
jgi:hypothetical protein